MKMTESEQTKAEENYEILNHIPEGIMILNEKFEIIFANKQLLEIYKMSKDGMLGGHCFKLTHHLDHICCAPDHVCPVVEYQKTGNIIEVLHRHFDDAGKEFFVSTSAYPILDDSGKAVRFIHIAKVLSEEVQKSMDDLKKVEGFSIDREAKMFELKQELNDLKKQLGKN